MRPGGAVLLSTADVCRVFSVPPGTVYRWAHEDGWAPHDKRGGRRWHVAEVQASYDRRRRLDNLTSSEDPS